ncbi:MAG: killer suppression protein [Armatimonadetes bacterium]|nr:killer suppression protein [Armatimonadota bacterium]
MRISFRSTRLENDCNDSTRLVRRYGPEQARLIRRRLDELEAAPNLAEMRNLPQARCHELAHDRKGQLAVDLRHPKRLVFEPGHDPVPRKPDGGVDWNQITAIRVLEIVDYHD